MTDTVPRIVHSIWLDSCPLPDRLRTFRETWRKHLAGFSLHEWTRHNLPLENRFVARQMGRENYCFACDYLRWERVYQMGGIYFDCDVEVLKPLDPILAGGGFLGFECIQNRIRKNAIGTAIFGFPARHWLPRRVLEHFHRHPDSTPLATDLLTQMMLRQGLDKFDLKREEFDFIRIQDVRVFHGDILYPDTHRRYLRKEDVPARSFTIHHVSGNFQGSELDPHPWYRRLRDYRLDRKLLRPVERAIKKMLGRR